MGIVDEALSLRLAELFKALGDPTRLRIIAQLSHSERCVHELAEALAMQPSAVSHQLRTLRQLRIVRGQRRGRHVFYELDDEHVRDLFERACEHLRHS